MPTTNRANRAERWKNSCFVPVVVEASGKVRWPPEWKVEQKRNYLEHSRTVALELDPEADLEDQMFADLAKAVQEAEAEEARARATLAKSSGSVSMPLAKQEREPVSAAPKPPNFPD